MDTKNLLDSKWVKAGLNVRAGDHLEIKNEGEIKEDMKGNPKLELEVQVTRDGNPIGEVKLFSLGKKNHKFLAKQYGFDSKNWVGKEVRVNIVKVQTSDGDLVDSIALSLPNTDESGNVILT